MCLALFIKGCVPPDLTEPQSIALDKRHTGYYLAIPHGDCQSVQSKAGMVSVNRARLFFIFFPIHPLIFLPTDTVHYELLASLLNKIEPYTAQNTDSLVVTKNSEENIAFSFGKSYSKSGSSSFLQKVVTILQGLTMSSPRRLQLK